MSYIYLGSPYSHTDSAVREARYEAVCRKAAELMAHGYIVFSPVAHSHPIAQHMVEGAAIDHDLWMRQDIALLRGASMLMVLELPGWEDSRGLKREIEVATAINIPVVRETPNPTADIWGPLK